MPKDFTFYIMDTAKTFNGEPFTSDMLYAKLLMYKTKNGQLLRNLPSPNKVSWHLGRNKKDYACVKRENKEGGRQTWYVLNPIPKDEQEDASEIAKEPKVDQPENKKISMLLMNPRPEKEGIDKTESIHWMNLKTKVEPAELTQKQKDAYAKLWTEKTKKKF